MLTLPPDILPNDPIPTTLNFECVQSTVTFGALRAKIIGGWLVWVGSRNSPPVFIPDPNHQWKLDPC